jgi:hypothetical protein
VFPGVPEVVVVVVVVDDDDATVALTAGAVKEKQTRAIAEARAMRMVRLERLLNMIPPVVFVLCSFAKQLGRYVEPPSARHRSSKCSR